MHIAMLVLASNINDLIHNLIIALLISDINDCVRERKRVRVPHLFDQYLHRNVNNAILLNMKRISSYINIMSVFYSTNIDIFWD
jgi:hypothetical protein